MYDRLLVSKELACVFKVLSHPDRIRIIETLRTRELNVNTLSNYLKLPPTRVSQHLAQMRIHRLVDERRNGRHKLYSLSQPDLAYWVTDGLQFLEARAASLELTSEMIEKAHRISIETIKNTP